ncbi:MAG: metal-dependent transcriptional regulator [Halodesulfurarchaeum sp.]
MSSNDAIDPVAKLPNRNAGRYLRMILATVDGPEDEVRPGRVADRLGVSPASVTEMTDRLAEKGYVEHEPYGGISLTRRGRDMARHLQWRQCVLLTFFETTLGVTLPERASYDASFALPAEALHQAREAVDLECDGRCSERIWEEDCVSEAVGKA